MIKLDNRKVYAWGEISQAFLLAPQLAHLTGAQISRIASGLYRNERYLHRDGDRDWAEAAVPKFYALAVLSGAAKRVFGAATLPYITSRFGCLCALCGDVSDQKFHTVSVENSSLCDIIAPSALVYEGDGDWSGHCSPPPICAECYSDICSARASILKIRNCDERFDIDQVTICLTGLVSSKLKYAQLFRARLSKNAASWDGLRFDPRIPSYICAPIGVVDAIWTQVRP